MTRPVGSSRGDGAGNSGTYLTDALGSAVALAGTAGVATNYGYDPYGVSSASGAANGSTYRFAGRENDGTGLYFNRARYYNPGWGRFISEDPIGLAGGINPYAYAANNPVSLTDPSGLAATTSATDLTSAPAETSPPATQSSAPGTSSASEPPPTGSPSDGGGGGSIELPDVYEPSDPGLALVAGPSTLLQPDPNASGPHTTFREAPDGIIQNYQTCEQNPVTGDYNTTLDTVGTAELTITCSLRWFTREFLEPASGGALIR